VAEVPTSLVSTKVSVTFSKSLKRRREDNLCITVTEAAYICLLISTNQVRGIRDPTHAKPNSIVRKNTRTKTIPKMTL